MKNPPPVLPIMRGPRSRLFFFRTSMDVTRDASEAAKRSSSSPTKGTTSHTLSCEKVYHAHWSTVQQMSKVLTDNLVTARKTHCSYEVLSDSYGGVSRILTKRHKGNVL